MEKRNEKGAARKGGAAVAKLYFHPQRGALVAISPYVPSAHGRYRGGRDSDWRQVATVPMITHPDGSHHPRTGTALPAGFLWGDPSKQMYGLGGPEVAFGPLEKRCRDCNADFIFTATEQKHWYEGLGFFIDATAVRCSGCRKRRKQLEAARRHWAHALHRAEAVPSATTQLAAAQAAVTLLERGGRVSVNLAIGFARRAQRAGERGADDVLAALLAARTARP